MDIQKILNTIHQRMELVEHRGQVSNYLDGLSRVDARHFGIAVKMLDGQVYEAGHTAQAFSLQSISKVFALALALQQNNDKLWTRVRREPSGQPFNSLSYLQEEHGVPRNPFINSGSIVVSDMILKDHTARAALKQFLEFMQVASGSEMPVVDTEIAKAEIVNGALNFALANYMRSLGNTQNSVSEILTLYSYQCAVTMSCRELAKAGGFLANKGKTIGTDTQLISKQQAIIINALMATCGLYDESGEFAVRVGLPGKSGIGGGILAVVPNVASIAVWSPGLTPHGNSLLGLQALEILTQETGWSLFGAELQVPPSTFKFRPDYSKWSNF